MGYAATIPVDNDKVFLFSTGYQEQHLLQDHQKIATK